ncbi:MAG: hypothetical protein ABW220_02750 [Burkholderiaceae bacterium]
MNGRHPLVVIAASAAVSLVLLAVAASAHAQATANSWEYKSYKKAGAGGQYDKDNFVTGTIAVEEADGKASFRLIAGKVDVCYRGALPAVVTRTPELTTIEVTQPVPGCEEFRYTIRNDGSGGFKEVKVGDAWRKSRFDHGLTPVK